MNKDYLLNKIGEYRLIASTIGQECKTFCADESIPIADRWEVFRVAPEKEDDPWYNTPNFIDSPYDDLCLEKYQTFDVVDRLDDAQEEVNAGETWGNKWGQDKLDEAKNFYMAQYLGSWQYNW